MPDRVFVLQNGTWGAVDYEHLKVEVGSTRFIEEEGVPHDSVVVDHTWRYVNKNGGPDRRFNNNAQLPICSYQVVNFTSSHGMNILLNASSHNFQGLFIYKQRFDSQQDRRTHSSTTSSTIPSCYLILGLAEGCSESEAQTKYRSLAKNYHPDMVRHMAAEFRVLAEERMKEINVAYQELRSMRGWS